MIATQFWYNSSSSLDSYFILLVLDLMYTSLSFL